MTRYVVPESDGADFLQLASTALSVLRCRPGCRAARVGRAVDDPTLWMMQTEWESVGSYRRALSAYEVKLHAVPLMYRSVDEPSAFEVLLSDEGDGAVVRHPSALAADAGEVGLGGASGPEVPHG